MLTKGTLERLKKFIEANESGFEIQYEDSMFEGSKTLEDSNIMEALSSEKFQASYDGADVFMILQQTRNTISYSGYILFVVYAIRLLIWRKR